MNLYFQILKLLFNKYIKKEENGIVIRKFCEHMGIVYIKLAQILATQNFGELFTENDRTLLSSICDNCNPIAFSKIEKVIKKEYHTDLNNLFLSIDPTPLGSASISQVHKAVLKDGSIVAIKVKRKDITATIQKDIKQIKRLMHRFGKFVQFGNLIGGDKALDLYLDWIEQETNFEHEKQNINTYTNFANSVNQKVSGTKNIKVPKVYENLCTENILVMEYINNETINKMPLTKENSEKIATALNSYIQSSFYALFHHQKIVFHGDPHGGNIYIDSDGNIGFLDMGLLFELSEQDANLTRTFFLTAYSGNYEKMFQMLIPYGRMSLEQEEQFKNDVKLYCKDVKTKPVTAYFTDMINICIKYQFLPPTFLFCMAKAFVCLNGINGFSQNLTSATELLQEQTTEYFIQRGFNDCQKLFIDTLKLAPKFIKNTYQYGILKGLAKEAVQVSTMHSHLITTLDHCKETLEILVPLSQKIGNL